MRTVDSILRGLKSPVVQGREVRYREATSSWVHAFKGSGAGGVPRCPDHKRFLRFPNGSRGRDPAGRAHTAGGGTGSRAPDHPLNRLNPGLRRFCLLLLLLLGPRTASHWRGRLCAGECREGFHDVRLPLRIRPGEQIAVSAGSRRREPGATVIQNLDLPRLRKLEQVTLPVGSIKRCQHRLRSSIAQHGLPCLVGLRHGVSWRPGEIGRDAAARKGHGGTNIFPDDDNGRWPVRKQPGHTAGTLSYLFEVQDNGKPLKVAYVGGTAIPLNGTAEYYDRYIASSEKMAKAATAYGATVLLSNHSEFDDAYFKAHTAASHQPGERNPFEVGADGVARYFKVVQACSTAAKLRVAH